MIAPESWTVVLSFIQRERDVLEPALGATVDGAPVACGGALDELSAGAETAGAPEEAAQEQTSLNN